MPAYLYPDSTNDQFLTKTGIQTITGNKTFSGSTLYFSDTGSLISGGSGRAIFKTNLASFPVVEVQAAASHTANLLEMKNSAGSILTSFNASGVLTIGSTEPLHFTSTGIGTYNRSVIYNTTAGLVLEASRETDATTGVPRPIIFANRGGGPSVEIRAGRVTDNGFNRAITNANFVMQAPGQSSAPNTTPARWDGTNFSWTGRILILTAGRGAHFSTVGYYELTMPASGTVIPGYGGAANITTGTAGFPIAQHTALYAALTPGGNHAGYSYAVVGYTADFVIPPHWVLIAAYTENSNGGRLKTGWGQVMDYWRNVTFQNGWANYGSGYHFVQYYKDGEGFVHIRGLGQGGTYASAVIFNLPPGYRPVARALFNAIASDANGRFDVLPDGNVLAVNGTGWMSFEGATFLAEN